MLLLDAGLWSGFQRQMELSESFEKTVVTVRDLFALKSSILNQLVNRWCVAEVCLELRQMLNL